ncbi:MAG: adenylate/guanylate cyclase domain-containing protein [Candidatus Peribacteraceae bacterium]|nr:adenylate/guanylate cyclase domain-containing protein [Candidatus Peribacteraceae bacterium]
MPKNKRRKIFVPLILILANALIWSGIYFYGIFGGWQLALQDKIYSTEDRAADEIVLVTIDDPSLADPELGRWQDWSRANFAKALENLNAAGAAVVGLDIIFSEPADSFGDATFAIALREAPQVVLAAQKDVEGNLLPLPAFRDSADVGFINLSVDTTDGVVRRMPLSDGEIKNFDIALLEKYFSTPAQNSSESEFIFSNEALRPPFDFSKAYGPIQAPLENGSMLINFFGKPGSFSEISFADIFHNEFDQSAIQNKIVLVGVSGATGIHDEQLTPVSAGEAMAGIEIHANILQTLLSGNTLQNLSQGLAIVFIASTLLLLGVLFFSSSLAVTLILFASSIVAEFLAAVLAFQNGVLLPFGFLFGGTFTVLVVALAYRYFGEGAELRYLQQAFSHYLAPELVRKIENDPNALGLRGAKRELTIFFSDLENFTKISEKMSPVALVRLLDNRLGAITKAVLASGGTLDKFIGDAVMAFWNAPLKSSDHAILACRAALATQEVLAGRSPRVRIGIHTGPAVVGNLGLSTRFNYTAVGDAVNLASRLEGVNKIYGSRILISGETYERVKNKFLARPLDRVVVKGRRKFTEIYELLAIKESATRAQNELAERTTVAFQAYCKRNFKQAAKLYREIKHPASAVLLDKIALFQKKSPPRVWRGETILKTK